MEKNILKKDRSQEIKVGPSESMSKSKKNTIDPENIIKNYGADAARLFILSDSPPEKDVQWSEEGIISSFRFIQKLWNLHCRILDEIKKDHKKDKDDEIEKFTNKLIKKVTGNLNNFSYNKIIANLHETYTFLFKKIDNGYTKKTLLENYQNVLILISPVLPHFSSECLELIKNKDKIIWPEYNESLIQEDEVNIVIQINGKKREIIKTQINTTEEKLLKLIMNNDKLIKYFENKPIKKKIYIKDKLINIIL